MKFGISDEHFNILKQQVLQPLQAQHCEVFIFGSRTTGHHHPYSDVDLLIRCQRDLPKGLLNSLRESIENSRFPYTVELVLETELAESYRAQILSQLRQIE